MVYWNLARAGQRIKRGAGESGYRLDADFKHGVHFTALPTAWVTRIIPAASDHWHQSPP
jgi:hypothetical protein